MSAAEAVKLGRRTATVLVVEDEFLVRTAVAEELRTAGYTVFEASDCGEALNILATRSEIELLFTDIALPDPKDGTTSSVLHALNIRV